MKNLIQRWTSDTPAFFKWVIGVSLTIATTCLTIKVSIAEIGIVLPPSLDQYLTLGIGIGAIGTMIAKLTKQELTPEQMEEAKKLLEEKGHILKK